MQLSEMIDGLKEAHATKPGYKTTEFYGKVLVQLVLAVNSIWGLGIECSDETSWVIIGGLEGLYTMWRSAIKARAQRKAI